MLNVVCFTLIYLGILFSGFGFLIAPVISFGYFLANPGPTPKNSDEVQFMLIVSTTGLTVLTAVLLDCFLCVWTHREKMPRKAIGECLSSGFIWGYVYTRAVLYLDSFLMIATLSAVGAWCAYHARPQDIDGVPFVVVFGVFAWCLILGGLPIIALSASAFCFRRLSDIHYAWLSASELPRDNLRGD